MSKKESSFSINDGSKVRFFNIEHCTFTSRFLFPPTKFNCLFISTVIRRFTSILKVYRVSKKRDRGLN